MVGIKVWVTVVIAFILMLPFMALASGTATLNVSATVVGTCSFDTASATLNFGNLNPLSAVNTNANASLQFRCSLGTAYTISDDLGVNKTGTTRRMKHSADNTQLIPYTLTYVSTGVGLGNSAPSTLAVAGAVLATDFTDAKAGSYSDTVTFTITP